ncbi:PD40 domain-containing protein [Flavisolibacter sp. BT320]|nr:PD40 domain-containing protein [Flavisolibacter longurius]
MNAHQKSRIYLLFLSICVCIQTAVFAQYFGRNKVLYQDFDFKVLQTPHFEFYTYLPSGDLRNNIIRRTEQWYTMHQQVLRDTFKETNPFILYNSHAHFQQTRAIDGQIDVGTGGVTEGLKNRVIMPIMESRAQTDHVLGHELVHAFQYHLVKDSFSLNALNNLPLWMVEGMAEYMSTGYRNANTAMWLRSGVASNKLPTLKDLTTRPDLYFPYRWGEAFWAYVTGRWGDTIIKRLFMETARRGYNEALKRLFNIDEKEFSRQWQEAIRSAYAPIQKRTSIKPPGTSFIGENNGGRLNVVPSISPDGQYIAFWSEKNLFSIDLFIADATTGKITERVTSNAFNSHVDQYSSYESAVAWSPDSRRIAFVAFAKGRNRLLLAELDGKIRDEIDIPGVSSFSNPTWSPDGKTIVVNGLVNGQSDLFAYNLESKKVKQLTNDPWSDFQPQFSPDGQTIAFVTDRFNEPGNAAPQGYAHNIALYNLTTGEITHLDFFRGANNMNPFFGPDPTTLYFLSDRDGLRNLYTYNLATKQIIQRTNLFIGITGITPYSPAISVSRKTGEVGYSYYHDNRHFINKAKPAAFEKIEVAPTQVAMQAAVLPPFDRIGPDIVQANILSAPQISSAQQTFTELPYRPKFQLDYIGSTGVGIQTGGPLGTGLAGGVNGIFSDILGNNQLFGAISLSGEIYDLAGQFSYLNQKSRINWGAGISHIPYLSGSQYLYFDSMQTDNGSRIPVLNSSIDLLRTFQDQLMLYASYPFSTIRRVEVGGSLARYYYRLDRYTEFYDESGRAYLGAKREKLPSPSGFTFGQVYTALVGDNSQFGVASPLIGSRYRFEGARYLGVVNLTNLTADYRKYFRMAPLTFATRNMYIGRFGKDKESGVLPPLYIGYPFLVRGYDAIGYAENTNQSDVSINDLIGSSMYVTNAELRFPLTGPERLSAIKSGFLFTELNLFTDGGIAWGNRKLLNEQDATGKVSRSSRFILSSGISLRVNLFGALIIEPYYAIPWQNGGFRNATFGLNFVPGY